LPALSTYLLGVRATCIRIGLATLKDYKTNSAINANNILKSLATYQYQ